ncbi:inositol hexakisphosphate-domain-containing protein [Fomitopsis serialis]|uniref:inositol hexakisphosphate-domain-containing protein n=1 Tax=Fomitopsis serialis TaxID=139415 RepID=UPI002007E342|nr:inositol hexakisphosphate-domain-containing protein [Neoantrodia serialis]KAH9915114.1 inositol hexakisphosphate-domain-containing protein [Neoantrodia serialis]
MSSLPRSLAAAFLDDQRNARPSSAPPDPERVPPHPASSLADLDDSRITPPPHRPSSEAPGRLDMGIPPIGAPIDLMSQLQRSEPSVVKTRTGSVLSRGFILKTDYWPSGRALDLGLTVHGAPNFRAPRNSNLNVFGVAQPRTQGLRGILSVLRCRPNATKPTHVIWFSTREEPVVYVSGRPFVLRDASEPRRTLKLSDRAENLEAIEERLKPTSLSRQAKSIQRSRYGGLILTHNEIASDAGEGAIVPTWTAVDGANVRTMRELMENMRKDGWNVEVCSRRMASYNQLTSSRIPISPERPIEDNYLDAYLHVIRRTDPATTALVFNCGMGAVRTTFAMVAACIIRRKQLIMRGLDDPYVNKAVVPKPLVVSSTGSQPSSMKLQQALEQASMQQDLNRSLLRITSILQQCLETKNSQTATELLLTQPTLLESLRKAHMGNYGIVLSLLGCLDHGLKSKKLADRVIDSCDQVTNLREDVFTHRVRYSLTTTMDETQREIVLTKAVRSLEKYFFIIAFAEYVDQSDSSQSFSSWLKVSRHIRDLVVFQVMFLRKSYGSRLNVFAPINDLSNLSKTGSQERALVPGQKNDVAIAGGQILGDEYSDHVVRNRSGIILREGTLLKSDQWLSESHEMADGVRGAINFRNIPNTNIYALGQPTLEAVDEVVNRVRGAHPEANRILWITLREEPIVYINGAPYCLRRERFTLRNMKDYGGISSSRLEVLEERLRDDVIAELNAFGGRLLLHTETPDGSVIPVWEEVESQNVSVPKDIMATRKHIDDCAELAYARIPITAERPPDFTDLSELIDVMVRNSASRAPIVVNCQLGRGRSTMTAVILLLIQQWLEKAAEQHASQSPRKPTRSLPSAVSVPPADGVLDQHCVRQSYQVINNLLRVVRRGPAVKNTVDDAIDQCAEVINLRESIEEARSRAEQATDERQRRLHAHKGLQNLRRYFELMVFQSYLQSIEPDTMQNFETFETFVENRPVIKTFEKELVSDSMSTLKPLERVDAAEGLALPDEVQRIVANRTGSILSASTILKSDFFSNLQKMSLPERIEGAPNFRRVPLTLRLVPSGSTSPTDKTDFAVNTSADHRWVCGCGMPTLQGLRNALIRVNAGPGGSNSVYWTSLREEPVIYVAGRPHVLRLVDKPLENVEATGVTTVMVEAMEENLKRDVIREVRAGDGRILLHDEVEERPGVFSIIPIWEDVTEDDIMTPRDVYDMVVKEGYKVNYDRVAVTDEQAPLPAALAQLLERVRAGLEAGEAADFIFNCQMGRGRTTTGMVTASLIATTTRWVHDLENVMLESRGDDEGDDREVHYDSIDGPSEEEACLQGEYKTILQLVSVLSHGKMAKRLTDRAIDLMQDVQNLRKAIYDYKLKVNACEKGSSKQRKLMDIGINYLYRYGALIVFANYLIEMKEGGESGPQTTFPDWLKERREITMLLSRRSLD